ncbi:hypothetical protein C5167_028040 [Papaver somniferum]|nr:hypothetical protein C5167_028040 [Papaver somniferum]
MGSSRRNSLTNLFLIVLFSVSWIGTTTSSTLTISAVENTFLECMSAKAHPLSQIHTSQTSSYSSLLYSPSIQNLRLVTSIKAEKPTIILAPKTALEIRKALLCSKQNGLQIRVRSGGHDYEGLSSTSNFPFIIIDLVNYRSISIHLNTRTAWVQAGATVGELFLQN